MRNAEFGMGKMEPRMDADCRELGRWEWGKGIGREDGGGFGEAGTRIWGIGWGETAATFRFLSGGGSLPRVSVKRMGGSRQETEWIVKEIPEGFREEVDIGGLPRILRLLLAQRGYHEREEVERFLRPKLKELGDPFLLPEMDLAVERIFRAVDAGETVCIFGDYDVDGITSITILRHVLGLYGLVARPFIPIRGSEGYGLSDAAMERLLAEGERPSVGRRRGRRSGACRRAGSM